MWQRQRRLSNPAFRTTALRVYADAMAKETNKIIVDKMWLESEENARRSDSSDGRGWDGVSRRSVVREVYADFNQLTLAITLKALFGAEKDASVGRQVAEAIRVAFYHFQEKVG